jgi:hypothetical protein
VPGTPLRPSPVFAAPFHLGDQPPRAGGADAYARTEHPTSRAFETAVGELDGGRCLSFATGMAAITAAVMALVSAGDRLVLPADGYYTTRLLARDELERLGVRVEYVPTVEIAGVAARGDLEGARMVFLRRRATRCSTSATSPRWPAPRAPPVRCWPWTTPPPPRWASGPWRSAPTSPWAPTPRR